MAQRFMKTISLNILRINLFYIGLGFFTMSFSGVRVISDKSINSMLLTVYVLVLLIGLLSVCVNYSLSKDNYEHFRKVWKTRNFILMPCTYAISLLPATFYALPSALHFIYMNEGVIEFTVEEKKERSSKYLCHPRIEVKELSPIQNFTKNHLCVPNIIFDNLEINDKFLVQGQVSPFGFYAESYRTYGN